ncbi:MAG: efflux transporter outer membrane subunit [Alistipes sp.]|nr:efflux transporter outer membrane subunit [Alistipes sp.]
MRNTLLLIVGMAGVLSGCTPRLQPPQVAVPVAYRYTDRFTSDSIQLTTQWWTLFGDSTLNFLVERALQQNNDLRTAISRIEQARANLRIARAEYLPEVGASLSAGATYNRETRIVQSYAVEPTLQWEISLFGSLRHATMAARSELAATEWACRGVELSLAAEVATTYFTLLQYERDLLIATRTYALRSESAALIDSMFRFGMSSGVDLEQARSLVYSAESDIPRYRNAVQETLLALNVLLGDVPQDYRGAEVGEELLTDRQPEALTVGLPSELLQRRPDIMQAYYQLQQAAAQAGVARSNRFPSLTLTAEGGIGAASLKGLTSSNPAVWSASGSLVAPLFNFGRLRSAERVAVEAYQQAAYSYEQTLLTAFSEVEKALSQISSNREQIDRYGKLVDSYRQIVTMAHALYRNGMVDYLDVIDAERTLYSSQMQYVNLVAQQYINYVSLCKALGGGWQ